MAMLFKVLFNFDITAIFPSKIYIYMCVCVCVLLDNTFSFRLFPFSSICVLSIYIRLQSHAYCCCGSGWALLSMGSTGHGMCSALLFCPHLHNSHVISHFSDYPCLFSVH